MNPFEGPGRAIETPSSEAKRFEDIEDYQKESGLEVDDVEFVSDQETNEMFYRLQYEDGSVGHMRFLGAGLCNNPEGFSTARKALMTKLEL